MEGRQNLVSEGRDLSTMWNESVRNTKTVAKHHLDNVGIVSKLVLHRKNFVIQKVMNL